jgi:hypothetical protein
VRCISLPRKVHRADTTYDEALWPDDPWYDPQRDPVTRMVEIRRGEPDVTEGDQLTLDVRRDCDAEYLRRAKACIRQAAAAPGVQGPQRSGRLGR